MDRARLTITLKPDILRQVDHTVDGARVRNRSHAIELLLGKALVGDTVPILILAGGNAVKNGNGLMPKALIKVGARAVLAHTLTRLAAQGFHHAVISTDAEGKEKIQKWERVEGEGAFMLKYTEQPKGAFGTAAAVRGGFPAIGSGTLIVQYGDVLADIDYNELLQFHRLHHGLATVALTNVDETAMWGVATMQGARIVDFTEKPKPAYGKLSHLVNAGICVLEPQAVALIGGGRGNLEQTLFPRLAKEGRLYGYPFEGEWRDVGASGYRYRPSDI